MSTSPTLILHSGGLRSLVATALAAAEGERPKLALLHLMTPQPNAAVRLDHVRRQAEHYQIKRLFELDMPRTMPMHASGMRDAGEPSLLARSQVLVTALAQAAQIGAGRVIWAAQFDGDVRHAAHATELAILATHLAEAELDFAGRPTPVLETPLAEFTDKQVIELGGQLEAPWTLAWSCVGHADAPCQTCEPCRRRHHAFEAAGIVDPQTAAATER